MLFILFILGEIQPQLKDTAGTVYYSGDTLHYEWNEGVILLTGQAELKTTDVRAKADTIKYESNKNIVTATGNPILWVGDQEIAGKIMQYDLNSGEGIIKDGATQIQKGWFNGKIIRKVGTRTLNIDYGKFTTCSLNPPHYYFWGRQLKVYVDDMVFTKPLVLCVKGIPLFVAPFWWFPIKKGRQSGFLYPKVGRSDADGRYIKDVAYYWVINEWSDATFTLNYLEKRGQRVLLEGRWITIPQGAGDFIVSYIAEQQKNRRWSLDLTHSQEIGSRFYLRANGNFISDAQYKVDYEEERLVQLDKIMTSYLSLTKSWDLGGINFLAQERKDLTKENVQTILPRLTYSLNPKRIFGCYFSYSGGITNSRSYASSSDEGYKQQSDNVFSISLPFKLFRYISVAPATTHTYTFKRPEPMQKPHHKQHSVSISTNIYGRSIFKPEFRHIMTPTIAYSIIDKQRSCSFSVSNDFQLLIGEKKIPLAKANLESNWNFDKNRINPINISVYSTPISLLDLQAYGIYKPYDEIQKLKFDRLTINSRLQRKNFSISVSYNWANERDESLWGNLNINLTKNWKFSLSRRYALQNVGARFIAPKEGKIIDESFSLYRDLHCWDMVFNFDRYGERWRYDFKLRLKAIPEIKIGKELFGIFL